MNVPPPTTGAPAQNAQGISMTEGSGGTSPGAGEAVRADWQVRMNMSHAQGFVGGAGRLLIHNEMPDDMTELTLYMPAASNQAPGNLRLLSAQICSAKPGLPAQAGAPLVFQEQGVKTIITLPVLRLNDWIYIDITWDGNFPDGGAAWPGAAVPMGQFHPQVAVPVTTDTGQQALAPIQSRYEVTVGTDLGAIVRIEGEAEAVTRPGADGRTSEHEFRSYGSHQIRAVVVPPTAV